MTWKSVLKEVVPPILVTVLRPERKRRGNYISAPETIAAAQAAGLSVSEYVERLWKEEGNTAAITANLVRWGAISSSIKNVVEIGPGTGRYIEQTLKHCSPKLYQVYEIDDDWLSWIAKTYPVEPCSADGQSLKSTKSNSVDLIQAYGVFVYLPFMITYRYFKEIIRVAAPGAFVVFNIISERCLEPHTVEKWIDANHNFPCFLSTAYVRQMFENKGFRFMTALSPLAMSASPSISCSIGRQHRG
jgi:phospholipid N-methyltransferase